MRIKKVVVFTLIIMLLALSLAGCGSDEKTETEGKYTVKIAMQYGLSYAPLKVVMEQKLIEKNCDNVEVEWVTLNSGTAITEALASGDLDFGAMGVAPAVTAVNAGVPVKIASNISAQPQKLMTNDPNIKSINDITDEQIALVTIGSIQHITLAMAAKEYLGDAHALDNNITAMSHPDGMTSLLTGAIPMQLTSSPYIYKEMDEGMTEVKEISDIWPDGKSFIVMLGTNKIYEDNPEVYEGVTEALAEAIDYINNNKEESAEMLCEQEDVTKEVMLDWLNYPGSIYSKETTGVLSMATFMINEGFIKGDVPESLDELAFDNVEGN
ncbi:MAG: ABC transporter substrate-binding protein [Peptostreptococcaceae bacterium]|nr:ABC transporter substrate-binding protein [Peptostreptococcaceae bacterium]